MKAYLYRPVMLAVVMALQLTPSASAQFNKLTNKAKTVIEKGQNTQTTNNRQNMESNVPNTGKSYYVNANSGSNRNDATTPQTAVKDLQKAIDLAEEGSVINIAQGNYLGKLDQGFIEVKKYISLVGGWNSDFTERNPVKYITSIRPGAAQVGTSGSHASLEVYVRGKRNSTKVSTTAIAAILPATSGPARRKVVKPVVSLSRERIPLYPKWVEVL